MELSSKIKELKEKIAGEIVMSENPGSTIRKWRLQFGIPQQKLARHLNLSPSVISDYETNRRRSPGIGMIRKIVNAMIEIDMERGGKILSKILPYTGSDAILSVGDFARPVKVEELARALEARVEATTGMEKNLYGYTMLDSVKAILAFDAFQSPRVFRFSSERALLFTGVKFGRSPLVAVRAHPIKPGAVVYVRPERVDPLAVRLAELENIPLLVTELQPQDIVSRMEEFMR